jgi:non-ribosomal peptide synthetase component E (peptide arylation enzyme)
VGPDGTDVPPGEPGEDLELSELTSFLSQRGVAKYKLPEFLVLTPALPSNAGGKIDKEAVRELAVKART